jgi:hypothetical protein
VTVRPTRTTVAGRAYLDLQNLARRQGRPTDELHQTYALEGFLARLTVSPYAEKLVLKGGVLLAAYDTRRPTRDVDLQGRHISNDTEQVLEIVQTIARIDLDDGLVFDADHASAEAIRDEDIYSGARVTLTGELSAARLAFHVDVNVGDPIWPAPRAYRSRDDRPRRPRPGPPGAGARRSTRGARRAARRRRSLTRVGFPAGRLATLRGVLR